MKSVLLIVVDALASQVVSPALERGELPNLAQIIGRGVLRPKSVAVFPSITPAATAALATGCYPAKHGIAGAHWYDEEEDEVAYYGDDLWVILREGVDTFFEDFLVRLNGDRLRRETAFEIIERQGLKSACLNFLWFRGQSKHELHTPYLLRLIPGLGSRKVVPGPHTLCLGDFIAAAGTRISRDAAKLTSRGGGAFNRFGFHDNGTADYLLQLVRSGRLPDFTLAYFPDNDFESHSVGPQAALPVVKRFDEHLGELFSLYGGCGPMLERMAVVITGDHSQSDVMDGPDAGIALDDLLSEYAIADAGRPWRPHDELRICPNMRAAQIYVRRDSGIDRARVIEACLRDKRIDQALWRERDPNGAMEFHVATSDRGALRFRRNGSGEKSAADQYGTTWSWNGALATIDGDLGDDGKLAFDDYPNAFERIAGGFSDLSGDFWLTARPGYAFAVSETSVHPRGSHGSLHALDSLSPLVVAGAPADSFVPSKPRAVDVLPLCLSILGIDQLPFELQRAESPADA